MQHTSVQARYWCWGAGLREAGWDSKLQDPPNYRLLVDGQELLATKEAIHKLGKAAVAALKAHEDSPAFVAPVIAEEVPDYYDIIKVRITGLRPAPKPLSLFYSTAALECKLKLGTAHRQRRI